MKEKHYWIIILCEVLCFTICICYYFYSCPKTVAHLESNTVKCYTYDSNGTLEEVVSSEDLDDAETKKKIGKFMKGDK